MKRASLLIIVAVGLTACDRGNPAGGRGYFDPPPPVRFSQPRMAPTEPVAPEPVAAAPAPVETADAAPAAPQPTRPRAQAPAQTQVAAQVPAPAPQPAAQQPAGAPRTAIAGTDPNEQLGEEVAAALGYDIGIDPNADSINLALDSQEVQERERAAAQARREAAQQQLVVVEPEPVPQADINANVVKFARETTHPVGTRRYNRPAFRDRLQSAAVCRRFDTADEAQRRFLANGGPDTDRFNLDPDGDGFACKFDPEKYRKLKF